MKRDSIKGVDTIILLVTDIDESVRFYRDTIGLSLKFKSPGWAEFVVGPLHIALHRKSKQLMEHNDSLSPVGVSINFEVDSITDMVRELRKHGIELVGEVKEYEFGKYFFISDPDGYIVGFREYKSEMASGNYS